MTPTATRMKLRLDERYGWFRNQWFFRWHGIKSQPGAEIDLFNGSFARYAGIAFSGTAHQVYWDAIVRGMRKEIVEQLAWVEEAVRPYDREVALQAIDESAGLLVSFVRTIRRLAVEKDRILRGDGLNFPPEADFGHWHGTDAKDILAQAEALKKALFPGPPIAGPVVKDDAVPHPSGHPTRAYQVALSFAGEQRDYVEAVAEALAAKHIAVFYDRFEAVNLWGKDGAEHFHQVFSEDAQYVVMFISTEYVAKSWTRHERRSAISRQLQDEAEYVLPVRFDETPVPGLPSTLQYLNANRYTPAELAVLIAEKIGVPASKTKASDLPPPASRALSGEVTFDYGAYDGRFVIGTAPTDFETKWSKGSDRNIHLYNDPPSINGIAIAKGAAAIGSIEDAAACDFSSRSRLVQLEEIAVLRNTNGFYAAVQILNIDDDTRGGAADALTIRYAIQPDGTSSFTTLESLLSE